MASSLPEELVQEVLVRLPLDEPVHLARASLVCKSWRRVLSDRDSFLRRCRGFHGAPPLLGYIQNRYYDDDAMQFVPAASIKSPVRMPAVDYSYWIAVDCRHGRVLFHFMDTSRGLIVCDLITGTRQQLSVPPSASYQGPFYTGAVLCAKDGCDHLDCQDGPFQVVFVETNLPSPIHECATIYSSLTGEWSAPATSQSHHNSIYDYCSRGIRKHSLVIGDVIYFSFEGSILKYDLSRHCLSEINKPRTVYRSSLIMKAEDGGLGFAALSNNSIHLWSRQDVTTNGIGEWVERRVIELETLLLRGIPDKSYELVGFAEGTNTILINISTGIFTLDIKSKKVRMVGEREGERSDHILPYVRFYTPSDGASGRSGRARARSTASMSMEHPLNPSKKFQPWKFCLDKLKLCIGGTETRGRFTNPAMATEENPPLLARARFHHQPDPAPPCLPLDGRWQLKSTSAEREAGNRRTEEEEEGVAERYFLETWTALIGPLKS